MRQKDTLQVGEAVTQHLAQVYANWALEPAKLFIGESESGRSGATSQLPYLERREQAAVGYSQFPRKALQVAGPESYSQSCL